MKAIKFYTLGCKVNQYETQAMREKFLAAGYRETDNGAKADICLVNTCTVTGRADSDSLGFIRRAKRENPGARVIITGCLAELDINKIKEACPDSIILKNKDKERVVGISYFKGHTRAFLKIQDGCDNFCSYCRVPLARGASRSKPLSQVIREARRLAENGFKEIVLTGICLGAYGEGLSRQINIVGLISALGKIEGLRRIRLSSIEASDVSDELIEMIAGSAKLCRHLHIPIQSGDDEILKKMNRRYSRLDYLSLIRRIRKKIPDIAITTDILVGFPGESRDNFKNTVDLVREIMPLKVHIFPYSPREGTRAFNLSDNISRAEVKKRAMRLKDIAASGASRYKKQFLEKPLEVLIENQCRDSAGFWEGYSSNYIKVKVKSSDNLKNRILTLKISGLERDYLVANSSLPGA